MRRYNNTATTPLSASMQPGGWWRRARVAGKRCRLMLAVYSSNFIYRSYRLSHHFDVSSKPRCSLRGNILGRCFPVAACWIASFFACAPVGPVHAQAEEPSARRVREVAPEHSPNAQESQSSADPERLSESDTEAARATSAPSAENERHEKTDATSKDEVDLRGAASATREDTEIVAGPTASTEDEALGEEPDNAHPAGAAPKDASMREGDFQRPWPERKWGTPRQGLTWDLALEAGGALRLYGPLPAYYFTSMRAGGLWLSGDVGLSFGVTVGSGAAFDRWGTGVELQFTHLTSSLWGQAGLSFTDGNRLVSRVAVGFSLIGLEYQHRFEGVDAVDVMIFKVNLPIGIFVAHL